MRDPLWTIKELILCIGDDPERDGLKETPGRVLRSYAELFSGYRLDPADLFKLFDGESYDELILLKDINFVSFCEHHLLPFTGVAHVAYIPNGKRILGISKLARLVEIYAKRLQVQERLTVQITQALDKYLSPEGSACVIEATHSCLACRGIKKENAVMVTSSLTGEFRKPEVRAELFGLIRSKS